MDCIRSTSTSHIKLQNDSLSISPTFTRVVLVGFKALQNSSYSAPTVQIFTFHLGGRKILECLQSKYWDLHTFSWSKMDNFHLELQRGLISFILAHSPTEAFRILQKGFCFHCYLNTARPKVELLILESKRSLMAGMTGSFKSFKLFFFGTVNTYFLKIHQIGW